MRTSRSWLKVGGLIVAAALSIAFVTVAALGVLRSSMHGRAIAAASGLARPAPSNGAVATSVTLPTMTLRQMAGQRVIYSYKGLTPPASLLMRIRHGEAAGVIFFGDNIKSDAQITAVIKNLERANASSLNPVKAPLLLMTDQEGGLVRRLPGAPLHSEKQIGEATAPVAAATRAGTLAGRNLLGVGMNVNLAPVLDVYRSAGDFDDQFGRSYSRDPSIVSELGSAFIEAQQKAGVAATAKHFPGLGAATRLQNTDEQPVVLRVSRSTLRTVDEFPYQAAIAAGVRLVMVSWATYPALDPGVPAGLSSVVVQKQLRVRLGFQGVTITDALEAGALKSYGTTARRAQLAAAAGMDLILCSQGRVSQGYDAMLALRNAYVGGTLNKTAFRDSVQRVVDLRTSLGS